MADKVPNKGDDQAAKIDPSTNDKSVDQSDENNEWLRDQTGEDHNLSGSTTFRTIADYPFEDRKTGRQISDAVVELVVDYSIPDVKDFVVRVEERNGPTVIDVPFERTRA